MHWRVLFGVWLLGSWLGAWPGQAANHPLAQLRDELRQSGLPDTTLVRINSALSELEASSAQGIRYAEAAVAAARRTGNAKLLMRTLSVLADQYARAVQPVAEQRVAQQILRLARQMGDQRAEALSFLRLAMISDGQENHAQAEEYFRRALQLADRPGIHPMNAAQVRCQWADALVQQQRYREAQSLLEAALPVATANRVMDLEAYVLDMLSRVFLAQRDYPAARRYAERGLTLVNDNLADIPTNGLLLRSALNGTLAATARATHDPTTALRYSRQALADAREGHLVSSEIDVLTEISQIAADVGLFSEAYGYQQRLKLLTDSLSSEEKAAEVARLQTQFESREKQAAIKALTQRNRIQRLEVEHRETQVRALGMGAVTLLLLLAGAVGLYWQVNRARRRVAASESQLRLAIQAKDRLYALIAHDLRGPVMSFAGLARMIGYYRRRNDSAGLDELTEEVDQASHQLTTLLDNLLDWARVQADDVVNKPVALAPAAAVAEVVALYHSAALVKQQLLLADVAADLPAVWADPNLLATVLRNLVNNAVKFAPEGGTITVAVSKAEAGLTFRVHNTGPGLPAARLAALLSPLDQRSTDGTAGERGTGLGLRISQSFAEMLGGRLQAASAPDAGVWLWFTVPAAPAGSRTAAVAAAQSVAG